MSRDDTDSMPIPRSAKEFSRRKGLKAMLPGNTPAAYTKMVADVTHQPIKGFRNKDASRTTAGRVIEAFIDESDWASAPLRASRDARKARKAAQVAPAQTPATLRKYPTPQSAPLVAQPSGLAPRKAQRAGERASVALPARQAQAQAQAQAQSQAKAQADRDIEAQNLSPDMVWESVVSHSGLAQTKRLSDAQILANKLLVSNKRIIARGMRAAKANTYLAQLRSNSTGQVQSQFFQRIAGDDTKEHWQPVNNATTGAMIGNASPTGYKLEVYYHTGPPVSTWSKIKHVASKANTAINWALDV